MNREEALKKYAIDRDLREADLYWADLHGADLRGASLSGANLSEANLSGASLSGASLSWANLHGADLHGADLCEASLSGANLSEANLREADLCEANLCEANLREANLSGANLPAPQMVLMASWSKVSDELCADLMEYDASSHPDRAAFDRWASGGACPYDGIKVQRACYFLQKRELWGKGKIDTPYNLMVRLLREKCKTDL